jgi:two-component system chemotaxis response regulator CheB
VLTGGLDDGTAGLWTIKLRGGTAIVQEPAEAEISSMPLNALQQVEVDHKLPVAEIGELLGRLAREPAAPACAVAREEQQKTESEIRIAEQLEALEQGIMSQELSPFTCPECHGVLSMIREGRIVRFRCHTGHAFSADSLLNCTTEQVEERLWDALRALDETVMLLNNLGEEFAKNGDTRAAERCFDKAREAHNRAQPIREAAMQQEKLSLDDLSAQAS